MRPNCFKEGMEWCNKLFVTGVGPTVSVKRSVSIVEPILAHTCEVFFNPPSRDTYCGQTFIFIVQERINSRFLQALELINTFLLLNVSNPLSIELAKREFPKWLPFSEF